MTSAVNQVVDTVKFDTPKGCIYAALGCALGSDILRLVHQKQEPSARITFCKSNDFRVSRLVDLENLRSVRSVHVSNCFYYACGLRLVCALIPPYPLRP